MRISASMPRWPGHPEIILKRYKSMAEGARCDETLLSLSAHTGTHVDAPSHFIPGALSVDELGLEILVGRALVVEILDTAMVDLPQLEKVSIETGITRILFKTRNSVLWRRSDFFPEYVSITSDAACWLADKGIKLVGTDYLSVQKFKDRASQTHAILLKAGIVIVEGLDLSAVAPGEYILICLPLKLGGAEGAPARAVLLPYGSGRCG